MKTDIDRATFKNSVNKKAFLAAVFLLLFTFLFAACTAPNQGGQSEHGQQSQGAQSEGGQPSEAPSAPRVDDGSFYEIAPLFFEWEEKWGQVVNPAWLAGKQLLAFSDRDYIYYINTANELVAKYPIVLPDESWKYTFLYGEQNTFVAYGLSDVGRYGRLFRPNYHGLPQPYDFRVVQQGEQYEIQNAVIYDNKGNIIKKFAADETVEGVNAYYGTAFRVDDNTIAILCVDKVFLYRIATDKLTLIHDLRTLLEPGFEKYHVVPHTITPYYNGIYYHAYITDSLTVFQNGSFYGDEEGWQQIYNKRLFRSVGAGGDYLLYSDKKSTNVMGWPSSCEVFYKKLGPQKPVSLGVFEGSVEPALLDGGYGICTVEQDIGEIGKRIHSFLVVDFAQETAKNYNSPAAHANMFKTIEGVYLENGVLNIVYIPDPFVIAKGHTAYVFNTQTGTARTIDVPFMCLIGDGYFVERLDYSGDGAYKIKISKLADHLSQEIIK